jgi:hypothetical protein
MFKLISRIYLRHRARDDRFAARRRSDADTARIMAAAKGAYVVRLPA